MPVTSPLVQLGLYALEIRQDGTPSADDLQPFSNLNDLRTGTATNRPYASWEPDFWLLDGEYKFLPESYAGVHVGMMSLEMSAADGVFATPPVLTITFSQTQSIPSLVLHFGEYSGDYADDITIDFYDALDALIRTDDYVPDSVIFSTEQPVDDFKKIIITFNSTNRPYRYLRLIGIDYGNMLTLEGAMIKTASVVEEVDQLSGEVRIGTADLRLHSSDAQFNLLNPLGYYSALAERQPLLIYEQVDNEQLLIGQFYLDDWENTSDTEIELRCVDRLGILDGLTYRGGMWNGEPIENLIEAILGVIAPYELDDDLLGIELSGWLPICSYRDALQQIAFAVGASVSCVRSGVVRIQATKLAATSTPIATITRAEQGMGGRLTLLPLITGVEVTGHDYIEATTTQQLYNGTLTTGTHEIRFNAPMHDLSISGATIVESGANYAIVEVAGAGVVTLSGQIYTETTRVASVYATTTENMIENILRVQDATLINTNTAAGVAQRIYDYYQQRYKQKLKLFAPTNVAPGDVVLVDTLYSGQIRAVIEKMDCDLSGGFVVKAELVGVKP